MPIATGDCYMHRQASFYSALFPEGTTVGPPGSDSDVKFFYLPVAEAGDPQVMLGAGDIIAAGTDKPETWDAILYASSVEYAVAMANGHAELSPRNDIDRVVDHRSAAGVVRRNCWRARRSSASTVPT